MTWINKKLQINPGSYGVLRINADSVMSGDDFTVTVYSYTDGGGKHQHNNFSFTVTNGIKAAEILYCFANSRKKLKRERLLELNQKYQQRGKLFLSINNQGRLVMTVGRYEGISSSGVITMTKKQAKKFSGYLFFWVGEKLIGKRKTKIPAKTKCILDITDEG